MSNRIRIQNTQAVECRICHARGRRIAATNEVILDDNTEDSRAELRSVLDLHMHIWYEHNDSGPFTTNEVAFVNFEVPFEFDALKRPHGSKVSYQEWALTVIRAWLTDPAFDPKYHGCEHNWDTIPF